ncbi:hypothetical protein DERF_013203 [Dermatophagoides farinae]|uniref:Protein Wnt n=2 Tax=Dermatophagoides farinae TaxID=6954 RepID=A0A922HR13_DERFA|nr:hypothetical protein DERF_013203 [Dermatophagoides farinae]
MKYRLKPFLNSGSSSSSSFDLMNSIIMIKSLIIILSIYCPMISCGKSFIPITATSSSSSSLSSLSLTTSTQQSSGSIFPTGSTLENSLFTMDNQILNSNLNNDHSHHQPSSHNEEDHHTITMKKPKYNWWRLGTRKNYAKHYLHLNATTFKQRCPHIDFLSPLQQELCSLHPNVLHTVSRGARFGIEECQFQFKMNRWNCSAMDADSVFGPIIDINSREKAFIHAISTAGVVYSVTRACTKGELSQCGCDDKVKSQDVQGKWDWGGCSDDIYYGAEFTRRFIDSIEDPNTSEGVMNLHNNEVGRRVIKSKMELVCKCHGVSGSCTAKVCWRRLKPFREVGQELAQKFDGATHVKIVQSRKKRSRLKPAQKNVKRPSKRDLVYLEDSPDFCFHNASHGSFGTTDRICNATSYGLDGCRYLCCGRGYRTIERDVDTKCNCKFVWCCQVKCDQCRTRMIEHRCN